jgi:hypothetical protein
MKRFMFPAIAGLALILVAPPAQASADWTPGFYVRGAFGVTDQMQSDLNDLITGDEQYFRSYGVPVQFDHFGGTPEFGGEVGYRFSETLSAGFSVMYQRKTLTNGYADLSGAYVDRMEAGLTEFAGNVSFWVPGAPGLFLGAQAGVGSGTFRETLNLSDYTDPTNDADIHGKWTGNGAVFGVFAGYEQAVSPVVSVFGRVGYRFRNLGHLDGTAVDLVTGDSYSGEYQNNAGQSVNFDFSGVHAMVGLGVGLGGGR